MRVRRTRMSRVYRRRRLTALLLVILVGVLAIILACRIGSEDKPAETTQPEPQQAQGSVSEVSRPVSYPKETDAPEAENEPAEQPWMPDEADVEYIAKTVYGEANIVRSTMKQAAVAWCILNRVDATGYSDTIEGVVTAPYQFSGYDPDHPVTEELRNLAVDVLQRWHSEQDGEAEVGRVLPSDYTFFWGDGYENYFTNEWKGTDYWDWSMPNPYEN